MATARFLAAVVTVTVAAALAATTATAAPPLHGTGISTLTSSTILSVAQDGKDTIIEQHNTRVDVGAFTGTVDEYLRLVIHPTGLLSFTAEATLNGTYAGCGARVVTQSITLTGLISPAGSLTASFATTAGATVDVHGSVIGSADSDTAHFEILYRC